MEQFTLQRMQKIYLYAKTTGTSPNRSWLVNLKVIQMGMSDLLLRQLIVPTIQVFGKWNSSVLGKKMLFTNAM